MIHRVPEPTSAISPFRPATSSRRKDNQPACMSNCLEPSTLKPTGRQKVLPPRRNLFDFANTISVIRVTRETHDAPSEVRQRITRTGGLNRFNEPHFRVVWGGSRLTWIGGRWTDRDAHGNVIRQCIELRRVPKYLPTNRWHVERWIPPESFGSPETWWAQTLEMEDGIRVATLGPYPSRGEYEHCFTLQNTSGEFISLSPTTCDTVARAIEWARHLPRSLAREALDARELRRARVWDRRADDLLEGLIPSIFASSHGHRRVLGGHSSSTANTKGPKREHGNN